MAYAISEKDAARLSDAEGAYIKKMFLKGVTYYLYVHRYTFFFLVSLNLPVDKF